MTMAECLGTVAPYYNLALVLIVLFLFAKLFFIPNKKIFVLPWKFLFAAVLIYVVEELLTVLNSAGALAVPRRINAFFEFMIIIIFVYLLLMQKEFLKKMSKKDA